MENPSARLKYGDSRYSDAAGLGVAGRERRSGG